MGLKDDERFKHIANDPKFRRIPKGERKVKIDNRFKSMFKDKNFKVKYTVDKRGRPVNHNSKEDLKRYYELSSESSDESDEEPNAADKSVEAPKQESDNESSEDSSVKRNELSEKHKTDKQLSDKVKKKLKNLKVDYARGEGNLISDSSSDDEESEVSEAEEDSIDHKWGELDADADRTDEVTSRLAVCNMDWDRIRATDLMVLFNSFLPPGSLIHSVVIYPSEFGLERMKEEETKGPTELVEHKENEERDEQDNEEGAKFHMEKLRKYQLNRLKYYYAVLTCDNPKTANKIYTECDGMEYESTATKIDLRFIPDDMTFDAAPKEICDKLPDLVKYQPRFFTTTALQQAKVDLTWDETNPERLELTEKLSKGKIDEISETDLQNYLAVSSSEESENEVENVISDDDDDTKNPIDKYKALLHEIESSDQKKKVKDVEMEISWGIDLKEKTEKLVKKKMIDGENKTPFQQYLDKVKERKKEKRVEKKNKQEQDDDSDIPSDIDMNDPYFAEEFNKTEFKKKSKKPALEVEANDEDNQKQAELELLLLNENDDNKKHFNLKQLQESETRSKKKRKFGKNKEKSNASTSDDFQVNVNDDRFSALFSSHHYNIDPTDPHYKKTKGMEKLIEEKIKRRIENDSNQPKRAKVEIKKNAELNVLVKSVKRKAEAFKKKI